MRTLTRSGYALAASALTLAGLGLGLGNHPLLLTSTLPLALLGYALGNVPEKPRITRDVSTDRPRRGESFEVRLTAHAPDGAYACEVHQPLPKEVLLEQGSNVLLVPPGERVEATFTVRAPKRGRLTLEPVRWEAVHLAGLAAPQRGQAAEPVPLTVVPRFAAARGSHHDKNARRETSVRGTGPRTTDFADLREYAWGDAMRHINWKASARRLSTGSSQRPLVNEYEHENRGRILVLLDAGAHLDVGTELETGLDLAIEAAHDVAAHHLARGRRVGFHAYHATGTPPLLPDGGPDQLLRIREALGHLETGGGRTLTEAIHPFQGHLRTGGEAILVTRITHPVDELLAGCRGLRRLLGTQGRPTVLDVQALRLVQGAHGAGADAIAAFEAGDRAAAAHLAGEGVRVIRWDPAATPFTPRLLTQAPEVHAP